MVVWPGIAAFSAGRLVGRMAGNATGRGFFTLGKPLAIAAIPVALAAYAWRLMPYVARRYRLTNRRVVIQRGLMPADAEAIELDAFDSIDLETLPGQEWLRAGDLLFRRQGGTVFRLAGVPNPQAFRQICLETRTALLAVREVLKEQSA